MVLDSNGAETGDELPGTSHVVPHARLDRRLRLLSRRPESYERDVERLIAAMDARHMELEISNPSEWRGTTHPSRVSVEQQFRFEVGQIRILDRDEELTLALRIDFAARRLSMALRRSGLVESAGIHGGPVPPEVLRRRLEWHALRVQMVERNLYLALIHVRRFRRSQVEPADLIQAAADSLFRAADGYDWRRGVLFRTYAAYWLRRGCLNQMYDSQRVVRVPAYLQKSLKHIDAAIERLGDPHPSTAAIARASGLSESTVASARTACRPTCSLDLPASGGDSASTLGACLPSRIDASLEDVASPEESIVCSVDAVLSALTPRERHVVELRFGIGHERVHIYAEIAEELGVSLERVRQLLVRALGKLRGPRQRKLLAPWIA